MGEGCDRHALVAVAAGTPPTSAALLRCRDVIAVRNRTAMRSAQAIPARCGGFPSPGGGPQTQ
jgi:predicted pyridoxine 5'-phosphate oxidase superfamily flavin-nucleotide-binding protein